MSAASLEIKQQPADWQVNELNQVTFTGEGEHAWFYVEKCQLNTADVVAAAADHFGVPRQQIGYAGRKDKHAVTRQWFSVPTTTDCWPDIPGTRVLQQQRHLKKLRVGGLSANEFKLTLRNCQGLEQQQLLSLANGFVNAFGPQRLAGDNLQQASQWLQNRRRKRVSRTKQGWFLSVLRSHLFNAVLAYRQTQLALPQIADGDVLVGGMPSAPLWGRGRSAAAGIVAAWEQAALAPFAQLCEGLEFAGVTQARRAMYVRPTRFSVTQVDAGTFCLQCQLPPGAYATSMLAALPDTRIVNPHEQVD